jgi:glucokinase
MGFAPNDSTEAAIAALIAPDSDHVSLETVLSGPGLARLHTALAVIEGASSPGMHEREIVEAGLGGDPACLRTIELFWDILAAAAGDIVLLFGARGGAFIGGGVAQRTAPLVKVDRFREKFCRKGSRRAYLERTPSILIRDPMAALCGAARIALRF